MLNKPLQKLTKLENAQSLRPYYNPNNNQGYSNSHSKAKSLKLIPVYQTKEFTKMKSLLPSIQAIG